MVCNGSSGNDGESIDSESKMSSWSRWIGCAQAENGKERKVRLGEKMISLVVGGLYRRLVR